MSLSQYLLASVIDRKKKVEEGRCATKKELVVCTGHYINQALRTLKRMQNKAIEWKLLREKPKITLAEALGRDRLIDERTLNKPMRSRSSIVEPDDVENRPG
jgi:hypothetical protein